MNKRELSKRISVSLVTVGRYMSMGMPYTKEKGQCQFDLDEVIQWRRQNIMPTYRTNDPIDAVPSSKQIATWSLNFALALLTFMEKKCCKKCQSKWLHDVSIGKFYVDEN